MLTPELCWHQDFSGTRVLLTPELREGVDAPDLVTVKDFLRFHIATSRVNTVAEWFFAGFTRITGTPTDEDRSKVYKVSALP